MSELERQEQSLMSQLEQQSAEYSPGKNKEKLRHEVLNHLIDQKLAEQEAKRLGISVSEAEVDAAIKEIRQGHGISKEQLLYRLKHDNITMEEYRKKIKEQIKRFKLINQVVNAKIVITEDKLKEYYKNNRDHYLGQQEYKVQHIVFSIPSDCNQEEKQAILKKAEKVRQQAKEGANFASLAREFSTYSTASEGGNLGYLNKNDLAPYMKNIILSLKAGEISPVVETPIGYQIFKVLDIKESKEKPFKEVKEEIYQTLFEQDMNKRFMAWIKELRERSYIKVFL